MRIEIITGHAGPKSYYQIERHELIIGSSNQCHLIIPNAEVSRRHLSLIQRGDRFFVIDHSSTNGTFINDEKLEPGQKVEWKQDTPMRLANEVILTLMEDALEGDENFQSNSSARVNPDHTKTMVIPLSQLKAGARKSGPPPGRKKKEKKGMGKAILIVAAILALAYYLNVEKDIRIKRKPKATLPSPEHLAIPPETR